MESDHPPLQICYKPYVRGSSLQTYRRQGCRVQAKAKKNKTPFSGLVDAKEGEMLKGLSLS
jgi:hypothetical protein